MLVTKARLYLSIHLLLLFVGHLPATDNNFHLQGHLWPMKRRTVRDRTRPLCPLWRVFCKTEDGKQKRHFFQTKYLSPCEFSFAQNLGEEKRSILGHLLNRKYVTSDTQSADNRTIQDITHQKSKTSKKKQKLNLGKLKKSLQQQFLSQSTKDIKSFPNEHFTTSKFKLKKTKSLNDDNAKYIRDMKGTFKDIITTIDVRKLNANFPERLKYNILNCTQNKIIDIFFKICKNIKRETEKDNPINSKSRLKRDVNERDKAVSMKVPSRVEHKLLFEAKPVNSKDSQLTTTLSTPSQQPKPDVFVSNRKNIYDMIKPLSIRIATENPSEKNTMINLNQTSLLLTTSESKEVFKNEVLIPSNDSDIVSDLLEITSFLNQTHNSETIRYQNRSEIDLNLSTERDYTDRNTNTIFGEVRDRTDLTIGNDSKDFLIPEITTLNQLELFKRPNNPENFDHVSNISDYDNSDSNSSLKHEFEQATFGSVVRYNEPTIKATVSEEPYSNVFINTSREEPNVNETEDIGDRISIGDIDVFLTKTLRGSNSNNESKYVGDVVYLEDSLSNNVDSSPSNSSKTYTSTFQYNTVPNTSSGADLLHDKVDQGKKNTDATLNVVLSEKSYSYSASRAYKIPQNSVTEPFLYHKSVNTVKPQFDTESSPEADKNKYGKADTNVSINISREEPRVNETEEFVDRTSIDDMDVFPTKTLRDSNSNNESKYEVDAYLKDSLSNSVDNSPRDSSETYASTFQYNTVPNTSSRVELLHDRIDQENENTDATLKDRVSNDSLSESKSDTITQTAEIENNNTVVENNNENFHPYPHDLIKLPTEKQLSSNHAIFNGSTNFSFELDKHIQQYSTLSWSAENVIIQTEEFSLDAVRDKSQNGNSAEQTSLLSSATTQYITIKSIEVATDLNNRISPNPNNETEFQIYKKNTDENIHFYSKNQDKNVNIAIESLVVDENDLFFPTKSKDFTIQSTSLDLNYVEENVTVTSEGDDSSRNLVTRFTDGNEIYSPFITSSVFVDFYKTEKNLPDFSDDFPMESTDVDYKGDFSIAPTRSYETYIFSEQIQSLNLYYSSSFPRENEKFSFIPEITTKKSSKKELIEPSKTVVQSRTKTQQVIPIQNSEYKYFSTDYEKSKFTPAWFLQTHIPGQLQTAPYDPELYVMSSITTSVLNNKQLNDPTATPELDSKRLIEHTASSVIENKLFDHHSTTPVLDDEHFIEHTALFNYKSFNSSTASLHEETVISPSKNSKVFKTVTYVTEERIYNLEPNFNFNSNLSGDKNFKFVTRSLITPTYSQFEQSTIFGTSDINVILTSSFENGWAWLPNTEYVLNVKSQVFITSNKQSETTDIKSIPMDILTNKLSSNSKFLLTSSFNPRFPSEVRTNTEEVGVSTFETSIYQEALTTKAKQLTTDHLIVFPSHLTYDSTGVYLSSHIEENIKNKFALTFSFEESSSFSKDWESTITSELIIIPTEYVRDLKVVDTLVSETKAMSFKSKSTSNSQFTANKLKNDSDIQGPSIFPTPDIISVLRTPSYRMVLETSMESETYRNVKSEIPVTRKLPEVLTHLKSTGNYVSTYLTATTESVEDEKITHIQDRYTDDSNTIYISSTSELTPEQNENTLDSVESEMGSDYLIRTEREVSPDYDQSSETDHSNDEIIRTERDLESFNEKYPEVEKDPQFGSDSNEDTIITPISIDKNEVSNGVVEAGVQYVSQSSESDASSEPKQNLNPNVELPFDKKKGIQDSQFGISTEFQVGTGLGVETSIDVGDTKIDGNINIGLSNANTNTVPNSNISNGNFDTQTKFNILNSSIDTSINIDNVNIGLKSDADNGMNEDNKFDGTINIDIGNENVDVNTKLGIASTNDNGIEDIGNPNGYDKPHTGTVDSKVESDSSSTDINRNIDVDNSNDAVLMQSDSIDANVELDITNTNSNGKDLANPNDFEVTQAGTTEEWHSFSNTDNMGEGNFYTKLSSDSKVFTVTNTISFEEEISLTAIITPAIELSTPSRTSIFNLRNKDGNVIDSSTYSINMQESTPSLSSTNLPNNLLTTSILKDNPDTDASKSDDEFKFTSPPSDPISNSDIAKPTVPDFSTTTSSSEDTKAVSVPERNPRESQRMSSTSSQPSTNSHNATATTEIPIIPFHFTIDANYDEVVGSRKQEFEDSLTKQLGVAMRVPLECIQNLEVKKGSIEVDFDLTPNSDHGHLADEKAMKAAADELKRKIDNGQLNINDLDGKTLIIVPIDPPTKPPPANSMEHTTLILGVVIGAFILTVIMVAITAIIVKRKSTGDNRLTPIEEARSKLPSYREIPFQEALFMKGNGQNKLSLGKYCYQTGQWLGPGPEPMLFEAPESVVYRPPTDNEIRKTPRPTTAVRERLKHNWEVDWDSMVSSR